MNTRCTFALAGVVAGVCMLASFARTQSGASAILTQNRIHTEIPRQELDVYAALSSEIVRARVTGIKAFEQRPGCVFRDVEVLVLDALKGELGQKVHLQVVGGRLGTHETIAPGAPDVRLGDEAVIFLTRDPESERRGILGLAQGFYPVRRTAGAAQVSGLHAGPEMLLASFEAEIRRVVSSLQAPQQPR